MGNLINNKHFPTMSYYYGYYDYYGYDEYAEALDDYVDALYDAYYEDAPVEAESSGDSKLVPALIWGVGAATELFAGLQASDDTNWDNVTMSCMSGGIFRFVAMGLGMLVPAVGDMWTPISGLTLVWSLANMYLISDAESAATQTNTNTLYGLVAVSALVSIQSIAMPMDKDDDVEDDYYYGDYYYDYYGEDDYYSEGDDYY